MNQKKRIFRILPLFLLATLLFTLAACGSQGGDTSAAPSSDSSSGDSGLYHLRIAYSPSLCQAPLHIAVEKGFFEAEGIEPENIQIDAAHVQEAIGADQVDVGFGLIGKFLQPVENGLPIKFTAGIHTGCVKIVAPKDSGIESPADLKGKKIAMSWAYSPSYGKPLSVPQGVIGLMTRFGMDVVLAHPEGYEVMGGVEEVARRNAAATGGSFARTNDMAEAFAGADIVYPKSWAPFAAMQQRTDLYGAGDMDGIKKLEKELLAQNANHKDWECTEALMASTRNGEALYMHCLPADISGVSCAEGEVAASVFDRYRVPLYKEASYKPYIIAAMITLARKRNPADLLLDLLEKGGQRCL